MASMKEACFAAVVYLPLDTTMAFHGGRWLHSCPLLLFTYGLQEFVMPTIACLTLSALCVEYCVTMFCDVTPAVRRRVVGVGVVVPWAVGFSALVPVFVEKFVAAGGNFSAPCVSGLWGPNTLMLLFGGFGFGPLVVLGVSLVVMLSSHCFRPPDERIAVRTILARSEGVYLTHEIADTTFACLISIFFNLPFLIHFSTHVQCEGGSCRGPQHVQHVLEVLRTAESVFFPAVWTLGMEFRRGLFTSCKCCYRHCDVEMDLDGTPV